MPETDTEALSVCLPTIINFCGDHVSGISPLDNGHFISAPGAHSHLGVRTFFWTDTMDLHYIPSRVLVGIEEGSFLPRTS